MRDGNRPDEARWLRAETVVSLPMRDGNLRDHEKRIVALELLAYL